MKVTLKSSYDDFDEASNETALECKDPSLTQQHDEFDANINNIVEKYMNTGQMEQHRLPPLQGDFTNAPDMQTAMNLGVAARVAFMEQPAEIRARFHNDAAEFVEYCSDPDNLQDLHKLGLLNEEANARIIREADERARAIQKDKEDAEKYRRAQEVPNK